MNLPETVTGKMPVNRDRQDVYLPIKPIARKDVCMQVDLHGRSPNSVCGFAVQFNIALGDRDPPLREISRVVRKDVRV